MKTLTNKTESAIYEMLTENTGASILDSGGAYGRHWEQNQKKTIDDFKQGPAAWLSTKYGIVEKSLYWHLVDHLSIDEPLTAHFDKFAELNPDAGYYELMDLWLDALGVEDETKSDLYKGRWSFNTYNFEHWLPNQTVQGSFFDLNGVDYLIMQVHGGCDVRGGYTKPRVFSIGYEGRDGFILNAESAEFACSGIECRNYLRVSAYEIEISDQNGNTLDTPASVEDITGCECGGTWNN
jgi:hypothetical protein